MSSYLLNSKNDAPVGCVIQDYINCLLASVTGTDAKDGHGLKIEKVG